MGCLAPLVVMGTDGASGAPVVADAIRVDSVVTLDVDVPTAPDTPTIWVAADRKFVLSAKSVNGTAEAPLSTTRDVTVKVSSVVPSSTGPKTTLLGTVLVPKDTTDIVFEWTFTEAIEDAYLLLESVERRDPVRRGQSDTFDVQSEFSENPVGTNLDIAIGGDISEGDPANCTPTQQEKICYELHFPPLSTTTSHLLSVGNCNLNIVTLCTKNLEYFWSIVAVDSTKVTPTNPIIADMGLDKSLKGITFGNGVPKARWIFRPTSSGDWKDVPDCPSRGVLGDGQEYCQDTSESHRDNSGDTWIRLLFLKDARGMLK